MRKLLLFSLITLSLTVMAATPKIVRLDVRNMACGLCPITVKKSLQKVPAVSAIQTDFDKKSATVIYDPDKARLAALTKAILSTGYPSTVQQ